ncbi:hypothetical protein CAPTEDRAFT_214500, partial [Capitella teleta]
WSWRLFENWGEFFELAITGVLMTSLEMWAFEISVFLAGLLGPVELSAQSIVFNLDLMLYALPAGLSVTCAIRTGQCLGAGRPTEARSVCYVAISCISITTLVPTILFATLRYELPKLFTNDNFCCVLVLNSAIYIIYLVRCIEWVELSGLAQRRARLGEFEDTKPDERTGLVSTESTSDIEKISNASKARSKSSAEWLVTEMPRALKIKSAFYIAVPVTFFVFCIFFKLFFSYDKDAILGSMPALFWNATIMLNATTIAPLIGLRHFV